MPWTNKKAGNSIDHLRGFIQLQVRGQDVYQDYSLLHQWSRKSSWIILATFWSLYKSILQLFKPNMYEEEFPKATRTQSFPSPSGWRRGSRWKIGHGGECKAENGLRHSSLSVSEWLVNSLVWRSKFQFSTNSRWRKEGREWTQMLNMWDVRSSHQGCRGSPCPPTPGSRSSPGIQQRKKRM